MAIETRNKIETIEIDFTDQTYSYISTNLPIEAVNEYYGHRPYLKNVDDITSEIKDKDTVTRRLKITLIDELDYIDSAVSTNMASYWRLFIARNKNYKGKLIRYYRRLGDGPLELKFTGRLDNIKIASNGNVNIEAVDLLKAMSKVDYPFMTGLVLAEDVPAIFRVSTLNDLISLTEAVQGDYGIVGQYKFVHNATANEYSGGGSLSNITYYLIVYAYNSVGDALAKSVSMHEEVTQGDSIAVTWDAYSGASYYRVFFRTYYTGAYTGYFQSSNNYYNMTDDTTYTPGDVPASPQNYYLLSDDDYSVLSNWVYTPSPDFAFDILGNTAQLENSGYLVIDEEIIYYDSIATDSEGASLMGVIRGLFETESPRHLAGTMLYFILSIDTPIDIFLQMKKLLLLVGLDDTYLSTKFDEYAAGAMLNVTTLPIIKETKLSNIYFDLVNLADCISFQNEDGLIDILKLDEMPVSYTEITDEANIIYGTPGIDLNEKSRLTRWILLWNRIDIDKSLTDDDAYYRGNITVDGDAEEFYGDVLQDKQHTAFLNAGEDPAEVAVINGYVNNLLYKRLERTNEAQWQLTAELEIKDDAIKLAQVVKIKTQKVIDKNGAAQLLKYRVMKKEPGFNKIKFIFQRIIGIIGIIEGILYYEDFTGSVYDSELFELELLTVSEEELKLTAGYCITCSTEERARFWYKYFRLKIKSKADTNISVTANAKQGGSGKLDLIGIYDTTRYFAGFMIQSGGGAVTDWTMKILIANGGYPDYLQDITIGYNINEDFYGYNAGVWNSFRVVYNASTKKVYFYIKSGMAGSWTLVNGIGYYVPEFEGREFYCGVQGSGSGTTWNPDGQFDNLSILYEPKT